MKCKTHFLTHYINVLNKQMHVSVKTFKRSNIDTQKIAV